jgi:hypothetical protein
VVEGTLIHIDDLLALLDELRHCEGYQILVLQDLLLQGLLAAILVLRLTAGDLVLPVEVAQCGVVELHTEPLLYLEGAVRQREGRSLLQSLVAQQVLLHLLGDVGPPPTDASPAHYLVAILLPQPDDGELRADLHPSDLEDI